MNQFPRRVSVPVLVRDGKPANKSALHYSNYSHIHSYGHNSSVHDLNSEMFW
jgi:hypothetical protein